MTFLCNVVSDCWPVKLRELQAETSVVCSEVILFVFSGKCNFDESEGHV